MQPLFDTLFNYGMLRYVAAWSVFVWIAAVPGASLLDWLGFRAKSVMDRVLATFCSGLAYIGFTVMILGFLGAYHRIALLAVLAAPAYLFWVRNRRTPIGRPQWREWACFKIRWRGDWPDKAASALCFAYCLLSILDSASTPFYGWDPIISWDSWAVGWGGRLNINGYLFGGYPQLLPILSSTLYKLAGSANDIIPVETFVSHGLHGVFASVGLLALFRICQLLHIPFWFCATVLLSIPIFDSTVKLGTADILVTSLVTTAVALALSFEADQWSTEKSPGYLLGLVFFAPVCAKLTGLLGLILGGLCVIRANRINMSKRLACDTGLAAWLWLIIPLIGMSVFYAEQLYVEMTWDVSKLSPYDHNFLLASIPKTLLSATSANAVQEPILTQAVLQSLKLLERLEVGPSLGLIIGTWLLIGLLLGLLRRETRPWTLLAFAYFAFWLRATSYDQRNLLPIIPLAVLSSGAGLQLLRGLTTRWTQWFGRLTSMGMAGVCLFALHPILNSMTVMAPVATLGPAGLPTRFSFMFLDQEGRVEKFFPGNFKDLQFLRSTALLASEPHIIASSNFFRFVPKGIYPLRLFSPSLIKPGDISAIHPSGQSPSLETWTPLHTGENLISVNEAVSNPIPWSAFEAAGTSKPTIALDKAQPLHVAFTGENSVILVNLTGSKAGLDLANLRGSSIVFRIRYKPVGAAPIEPILMSSPGATVELGTSVPSTPASFPDGSLLYSGVITISRSVDAHKPGRDVVIGLRCHIDGQAVTIVSASANVYSRNKTAKVETTALAGPGTSPTPPTGPSFEGTKSIHGLTPDRWVTATGITIHPSTERAEVKSIRLIGEVPNPKNLLPLLVLVRQGDRAIGKHLLSTSGQFSIRIDLPKSTSAKQEIRIVPDKHFVPQALGINSDSRSLAFRLNGVEVD